MPHPQRHQAHQGAGARDAMSRLGGAGERFRAAGRAVHSLAGAVRGEAREGPRRKEGFPRPPCAKICKRVREIRDAERTPSSGSGLVSAATLAAELRWLGLAPLPPSLMQLPTATVTCHKNFCYSPLSDLLVYHV